MTAEAARPWKVSVEEHVIPPGLVGYPGLPFQGSVLEELTDTGRGRLALMDSLGIELAVLSLAGPGVQAALDAKSARDFAATANSLLAEIVMKRPDRYAGLAALPMQDPTDAIGELERSVVELGLSGVLVNGYSCLGDEDTGLYLDDPAYLPFWDRVEALDVPFYLHPRNPLPNQCRIYQGHAELLGAPWAFSAETAVHALRLMTSGLFDRFPRIKIVLGHLGETLPFVVHRAASRMNTDGLGIKRSVAEYLRQNFVITTSGNFHNPTFVGTVLELGVERVLFALDYPFADAGTGSRWFDSLELNEDARFRIGRSNAAQLFRLRHHLALAARPISPVEAP